MPPYLTFTTAKVKIKLPSYFFPNSHGCVILEKKHDSRNATINNRYNQPGTTLEVLNELSIELPETKQFMEEHLEQKCLKENQSVEEEICFYLSNPEAESLHIKHFKAETFLELCLARYVSG